MRIRLVVFMLVGLSLAACSAEETEDQAADCVQLSDTDLETVGAGLRDPGVELTEGASLSLDEDVRDLNVTQVVAVDVAGEVAIFGTGGDGEVAGPVFAANDVARAGFDWGEAAEEGGPARDYLDSLAASDAAADVVSCA